MSILWKVRVNFVDMFGNREFWKKVPVRMTWQQAGMCPFIILRSLHRKL